MTTFFTDHLAMLNDLDMIAIQEYVRFTIENQILGIGIEVLGVVHGH